MPPDDFEENDKKQPGPSGEINGLEETSDEVEYEPLGEGESFSERKGMTGVRPHGEEDKGLKSKLKRKEAEIKVLEKDFEELKDKYLRKLAEMENLRKRFERERSEYLKYALGEFLKEMLVLLDNFERALKTRDQADGKNFQEGVEMIYRQCLDLVKKRGVRPIELMERKFDPTIHHAIVTEESDEVEEPEIAEELQRGYWLEDRLLRPSLVKVLVPKRRAES
jgi:molecular chaperone GrpE